MQDQRVLVVNRYRVLEPDGGQFLAQARPALQALADRPGFVRGRVGRSSDDTTVWVIVTEWASVGAYRPALGGYEVKLHAVPLMYQAIDEPGAFEVLLDHDGDAVRERESDRAPDSLEGPGRR